MNTMAKLIILLICIVTVFANSAYAGAISTSDYDTATILLSDYYSRFGVDMFQWDQKIWHSLGNELRQIEHIYQTEDDVAWAFACQVYADPNNLQCTANAREAAIEYARCLLLNFENKVPLKTSAVYILDNLDKGASGRWVISFQTKDGIYTYELSSSMEFCALHFYGEAAICCMPFISGNTFLRRDSFPVFWRTKCAPESFWNIIEPYCMTCIDMDAMLAKWRTLYDYNVQPSLYRAIDYLWTSRLHPGDSFPVLYGIPSEHDLSTNDVIKIIRETCDNMDIPFDEDGGIWIAMQYNHTGVGTVSWNVSLFESKKCSVLLAWFELDDNGEIVNWSLGSGNG